MYREQTAGPKSAIFCASVGILTGYVRKLICIQIVNVLDLLLSRSRIRIVYIGKFARDYLAKRVTDMINIVIANTYEIAYSHLTLENSNGQDQGHVHFDC